MIQKVVNIKKLQEDSPGLEDLAFWLSKSPEERIEAVEYLRRQYFGSTARLQRTAEVIQRISG